MNMKLKMLAMMAILTFFLTVVANTPNASAKAEIWNHDVGKDVGSDTQTVTMTLPPSYLPYTEIKWTSTMTWSNHWAYHTVFDGSLNLHTKVQYMSGGTVQNDFWYWNEDTQEWFYSGGWLQKLKNIWGQNELLVDLFGETQTSKQLNINHEIYKMEMTDPLTGETLVYEYMVMRYMMIKWVNGELQFENSWEIMKE